MVIGKLHANALGRLMAACAVISLTTHVQPGAASNDLCGAVIVTDLQLDHDLSCTASGLIAGADGITLNLNGHTISGSGTGAGVIVIGRSGVSIEGGTVQNFEAGVRIMDSTGTRIEGNVFAGNGDGNDLQSGSVGNTIKENAYRDNRARGIMLRGGVTGNVIKENTFAGNRVGILVFAGVDNTVKENVLYGSGVAAIRINVFASGNIISENAITTNPAGVEFLMTASASPVGNTLIENLIEANTCGLKGPAAGNTLTENILAANAVDHCL